MATGTSRGVGPSRRPPRPRWSRMAAFAVAGLILAHQARASSSCSVPSDHGQPVVLPASPPEACLAPTLFQSDPDVAHNLEALRDPALCLKHDDFEESGVHWHLLIIQNVANPGRVFWMAPHNNEHTAFNTAVFAVKRFGGTVVAVRTDGERCNGSLDPNRNFDAAGDRNCTDHSIRSPLYTARVLKWRADAAPIIAMHTNDRGFGGGAGNISIRIKSKSLMPFPATPPFASASPDDTMIYVSSLGKPGTDPAATEMVRKLNAKGINVQYETVTPAGNDCSLSNYALLHHLPGYNNLEALHGDDPGQREELIRLLDILGINPLGP